MVNMENYMVYIFYYNLKKQNKTDVDIFKECCMFN